MNSSLPAGIEAYLSESGFSATEMLILRKLMEEDSFTIRELASKTGKSTGVLDQAMKKLLSRKIAKKEIINDQPRYSIDSLDAVLRSMQRETKQRKEQLDRRHHDFESFISSLTHDKHRPDMEYFHGLEGIQKAYMKLLDTGQELLTFTPVLTRAEDDPLRIFRVDYFRKRQYRKIFQRILAPDTPLARRFQSRDAFEYRRTFLLPADEYPMTFEKTIVHGLIACINFTEQTACLLRYPDLAQSERTHFESLWQQQLKASTCPTFPLPPPKKVPLKTHILSNIREFILSKKSIAAFILFALISGVMTYGLYQSNRELNLERIRQQVLSIAATGALQLDAKDIDAVRTREDSKKPEYAKLIATLNLIRRANENIQYAYIMRHTDNPKMYAFVADADSLDPNVKKDINVDGKIDAADQLNYPGEPYNITTFPIMSQAFAKPVSDFGTDQWGHLISGFSPIYDASGKAIAILGIDMFASEVDKISAQSFSPLFAFIGFFFLFVVIRFGAVNRSLILECFEAAKVHKRIVFLWFFFLSLCISVIVYGVYSYKRDIIIEQTGERLKAIAVTTVNDFHAEDLDQLHWAKDMKKEAYQRVFKRLNEIRNQNPFITFAYVVRPTQDPDLFEFVVDADMNYNLPSSFKSFGDFSPMTPSDANAWPGVIYDDSMFHAYFSKIKRANYAIFPLDQWGSSISGSAPIFRKDGSTAGILCFDVDLSTILLE